jgi:hypothetical protein
MKVILVKAFINLASPQCRSPNRATFADEQIVWAKFEASLFRLAKMHLIQLSQIQTIPKDIFGSEKGALVFSIAISLRNLFPLLNMER